MRQQTLADNGFERFRKRTRRETFLLEMDQIIPWRDLCKVIKPFYPKPKRKGAGRSPVGLERMLRIHFLQHWFNLSDPAVEEALYDSRAMRSFVGIDLGREPAPDETTVCKFRHLLEAHNLGDPEGRYYRQVGDGNYDGRFRKLDPTVNGDEQLAKLLISLGANPYTGKYRDRSGE